MLMRMGQHESNGVVAMQSQMDETEARKLRQLAAEVSNAVEARIVGEAGAGERIRRSTQHVQIAGMGPAEYWGTQLWQVSNSSLSFLVTLEPLHKIPGRFPSNQVMVCMSFAISCVYEAR